MCTYEIWATMMITGSICFVVGIVGTALLLARPSNGTKDRIKNEYLR